MRMLFVAAAAAAFSFSASAQAETADAKSFTYEGVKYTYVVQDRGSALVIKGKASPVEKRFVLTLANGRVTGQFGGYSVAFKAEDAKGARNTGGAELLALLGQ